jgi:hypothetical protein
VGELIYLSSGRLYLDASAIIYSVEKIEPYWTILQPIWHAASRGDVLFVGSELLLLEVLVKPIQKGDTILADSFRHLLKAREFTLPHHAAHFGNGRSPASEWPAYPRRYPCSHRHRGGLHPICHQRC